MLRQILSDVRIVRRKEFPVGLSRHIDDNLGSKDTSNRI